ncbi:hypothetical protein K432DRAFT_310291 [Lepidopterella palustris CBS 459.81]|uniref:Cyclin N-terminal domain-containing protein n=1 Tax=Lepidopterella palustris CBS 459.81 TaxID=1314670 RepID=A0A8E2DZT2_9PEZI|nr:hypothetical protein K432DRAFT_310291 [Lepidopterella palustris CBS 459.81]
MVEYADEIFDHMKNLEIKMLPTSNYMETKQKETELNWSMRSELIDWLVRVHYSRRLQPEILFRLVNYIDRFLSVIPVRISLLQLIGLEALSVAAKFNGVDISATQLQKLCENSYSIETILKVEIVFLRGLDYDLGWPGPLSFLQKIYERGPDFPRCRQLPQYLLEAILTDERFIAERPSLTAAAAYYLARQMLNLGIWSPNFIQTSGYKYEQLYPIMNLMMECCKNPYSHYLAVFKKYSRRENIEVALLVKQKLAGKFVIIEPSLES